MKAQKKKIDLKRKKHFTFSKKQALSFIVTETTDPTTATATTVTTTQF
jgi:hypothetical protein